MKDLGLPEDMLTFVNFPTRFDCREALAALKGSGIECPPLRDYAWRLWDYWERYLDPALQIDHTLRGTVAARSCSSPAARRASAWRRRASSPRPARSRSSARATRTSSPRRRREILAKAARAPSSRPISADIADEASCKALIALAAREARRRRFPDQQRRPLDPPRDRGELRPLPRLRADDAAQLLRLPARHDGPAARHGREEEGPHRQHQLDRRADERAALLGLRRVEGGARRVDALRVERVRRRRHHLHDDQHAAGAHADDRADRRSTTTCRRSRPRRPPT